ncbi:hypothetical protein WJX72_003802 [[Myrmecia] bisecta]|uniref:Uncharacterized protein n=1 Tax=[Myrmecia] bisecta TaxID=41462 RepID=A0AAW1PG44_9CHLO
MATTDFIDLSAVSDDEYQRPRKRPRDTSRRLGELFRAELFQARACTVTNESAELDAGEDLAITGGTGVIWNRDLPHCRDTCGFHKFAQGECLSNSRFCDKCYCFVCDCKAARCVSWGTGARTQDHCNALKCKAVAGGTILDIKERLDPFGYYLPDRTVSSDAYDDVLCIDNLLDKSWVFEGGVSKLSHSHLQLCKLPVEKPVAPPNPFRLREVVVHPGKGVAPVRYGLQVDKQAKVSDLHDALADIIQLQEGEQWLTAQLITGDYGKSFVSSWLEPTAVLPNDAYKRGPIQLFRVLTPEALALPDDEPCYAVCYQRRKAANSVPTPYEQFSVPTVIPLQRGQWKGGQDEAALVTAELLKALQYARKARADGTVPRVLPTAYLSNATVRLQRASSYGSIHCGTSDFSHTIDPHGPTGLVGKTVFLFANWRDGKLDGYNMTAMEESGIRVDASVSGEALAETARLIEEEQRMDALLKEAKLVPVAVMDELIDAAKTSKPGNPAPDPRSGEQLHKPAVRLAVDIEPASDSATERKGTLVVKVYTWLRDSIFNRSCFDTLDTWPSVTRQPGRHNRGGSRLSHPLQHTLEFLLAGDDRFKRIHKRMCHWKQRDVYETRTLNGLIELLESPEGPEADQPEGLTVQLKPYQKQSLKLMLDAEQGDGGFRRFFWVPLTSPAGTRYWYSPVLHRLCTDVPAAPWGGFLAEEMGLGKTVETCALLLANPAPALPAPGSQTAADGLVVSHATLVVCAVSLVGQWCSEAADKLRGSLRVYMYHGQGRTRDIQKLAMDYDLVVTTYATLTSDYGAAKRKLTGAQRNKFPPLGTIKWHRVVLDESHTVKNPAVSHSEACTALASERRWCCTGTPINTAIDDLLGQFGMLHMVPFSTKAFFDSYVKPCYTGHQWSRLRPLPLLYALGATLIRHTKSQLTLPEKTEETVAVIFTREEQALYKAAHTKAKQQFQVFSSWGAAAVSSRLLQIMSLLQPLRRICSSGALSLRDLAVPDLHMLHAPGPNPNTIGAVDGTLVAPAGDECAICLDALERPVKTPCNHWFCRECISGMLEAAAKCPLCRSTLRAGELTEGVTEAAPAAAADEEEEAAGGLPDPVNIQGTSESKLQALLRELRAMRAEDESAKALVFSQYVSTIEWLKTRLTEEGFGYRYISGSMPLKQRTKAIDAFQNDPPCTVFLLSMRVGSVGINLTAANYVFLLEPAINPALEDQAIGRAWRMGQSCRVVVKKFYVKGPIEERIMEMVKQRREGTGAAAEPDHAVVRGNARRATEAADLAGSLKSDRQMLELAELDLLFRDPDFSGVTASAEAGPSRR